MTSQILSQEEIDALLNGTSSRLDEEIPALTDMERDTLGEIANISLGSAATTLSTLLGKKVEITTPKVSITTRDKIQSDYPLPYVVVEVSYTAGLSGVNLLVIKKQDAATIVDLMMGGDGSNPPEDLTELHISAISEAMNQMMGASATSMSTMFRQRVDISPPSLNLVDFARNQLNEAVELNEDQLAQVSFRMTIEGLVDSELMQLVPIPFAKDIVNILLGDFGNNTETAASVVSLPETSPGKEDKLQQTVSLEDNIRLKEEDSGAAKRDKSTAQTVTVQPVQFTPLTAVPPLKEQVNLDLILDISLQVSVELGRTRKTIKEILELGPGSLFELDKLAGEPVDILVNNKLIAKGEVVVVDENFGVRVTDIVTIAERMKNLQ